MKSTTVINTVVSILNIIIRHLWLSQKTLFVRRFMVIVALFFILPVHFSWAQIYVDACYEGWFQIGTKTYPFKTLEDAVAAASPDDIIYMKGGIYPETLTITQARTITAYDRSALVGTSGDGVIRRDVSIDLGSRIFTNARVYYPSCGPGPFPAVVYAHGKRKPLEQDLCSWCDDALRTDNTKDYMQADGILKRLASSGVIAISFNWSGLARNDENIAEYIITVITYLGNEFGGSVDLQNLGVGLIGHSTGGAAAIIAAQKLRDMSFPPAQLKGVGLIAPGWPLDRWNQPLNLSGPVLVIHGTREHPCQVGLQPLEIYCEAGYPKFLVSVTGANHFGYTDGICLNPGQAYNGNCIGNDPYGLNPHYFLPNFAPGWDNSSRVGGKTGQEAQALQQRAAGNYLQAFFSKYLHHNNDALKYLVQKNGGEQCGHQDDRSGCINALLLDPPSNCEPKSYFDDLQSLNVEVSVCSCTE